MNPGPPIQQNIRLATSNVKSVHNKSASITDLVISKKFDIYAVTETYLTRHDTTSSISDICLPDYSFYHQPHHSGCGGGVDFLVFNKFEVPSCPDLF